MDPNLNMIFAEKILEVCDADKHATIYSLLPLIDHEPHYFKGVYAYNIGGIPKIVDSAIEVLANRKMNVARSSYEYIRILKEKENLILHLSEAKKNGSEIITKISDDKVMAALALLSHIYLESFVRPIQFFLPHSSACSGQWKLWENNHYFKFLEKMNEHVFVSNFKEKITRNKVWNSEFKPEEFSEIVRRRLNKENAFEKRLNAEAMIKAIIIRMGEIAQPNINYEVIDYSIRSFFTYLGTKQYLRVDREIEFLRRLEKEIRSTLKKLIEE